MNVFGFMMLAPLIKTNKTNLREKQLFHIRVISFSFCLSVSTGGDSAPRTRPGAVSLKHDSADVCHRRIRSGRD